MRKIGMAGSPMGDLLISLMSHLLNSAFRPA